MKGEKNNKIITKEIHPDIYDWLSENFLYYKENQKHYTLTSEGKINAYCNVFLFNSSSIKTIKYPFGYVKGGFYCNTCQSLTSLIGFPKHIAGDIIFYYNTFSNNPLEVEKYKIYLAMWLELLNSVSDNAKLEYIDNYKDKVDKHYKQPILPKEVINKYKVDFLLKELNYGR